jgi:ABC-2 type transport system permease protein
MGLAKTGAMARKEIRELRRDRRQVALLIVMPLLLLLVFGYAASFDVDEVSTLVAGPQAAALAPQLPGQLEVTATDEEAGRTEAEEALRRGDQVVAVVTGTDPVVLVDGTELFAARGVVAGLQTVPAAPPVEVLYNPELETALRCSSRRWPGSCSCLSG